VLLDNEFDDEDPIADAIDPYLIGRGGRWNRSRLTDEGCA
jgi:hypothetical protein